MNLSSLRFRKSSGVWFSGFCGVCSLQSDRRFSMSAVFPFQYALCCPPHSVMLVSAMIFVILTIHMFQIRDLVLWKTTDNMEETVNLAFLE